MFDQARIQEIEAELTSKGKTVSDLCKEANVDESTWNRWKNGRFFPSYKKAVAINSALEALLSPNEESAAQ